MGTEKSACSVNGKNKIATQLFWYYIQSEMYNNELANEKTFLYFEYFYI